MPAIQIPSSKLRRFLAEEFDRRHLQAFIEGNQRCMLAALELENACLRIRAREARQEASDGR